MRRDRYLRPTGTLLQGTMLASCCGVEVRHGFIVGIFNYCDRWCEACPFTSRCRLFADLAETEASFDPGLKALVASQALFRKTEAPPPWLEELLEDLDDAIDNPADDDPPERAVPPEHAAIEERAHSYSLRVYHWLKRHECNSRQPPSDPLAIIGWFHTLVPAKIHRAIQGLADDRPENRDWPPDYDGSAKVALLGIERSHAAFHDLVAQGTPADADVTAAVADLAWLADALERVFPNARAFVRPGFDEPEEVSRLEANDWA